MSKKLNKKEKQLLNECRNIIRKNPKLKKKKLHRIKDLEKRKYYCLCWSITENQPLFKLKNFKKRCYRGKNCYHLDHIVSIAYGYTSGIPPEKIGSLSNLRFIPAKENMRKGHKLTEDSHKVLRKFNRKR
jgi:hypothetical protein